MTAWKRMGGTIRHMDKQQALTFCRSWLKAWTGNKPEELITFYAEDAFYRDPVKPKGLRGRSELLMYFRSLLKHNPSWIWEADEIFTIEGGFVLRWRASIPAGRIVIRESGLDIVLVENGLITRNEVYFDRSRLLTEMEKKRAKSTS
jgi:hypothetical protein